MPVKSERHNRKVIKILECRIMRERRESVSYTYRLFDIISPHHNSYTVQDTCLCRIEDSVLTADSEASKLRLALSKTQTVSQVIKT